MNFVLATEEGMFELQAFCASAGVRGASPAPHLLTGANGIVSQGSQPGLPFDNIYEGTLACHMPPQKVKADMEVDLQVMSVHQVPYERASNVWFLSGTFLPVWPTI